MSVRPTPPKLDAQRLDEEDLLRSPKDASSSRSRSSTPKAHKNKNAKCSDEELAKITKSVHQNTVVQLLQDIGQQLGHVVAHLATKREAAGEGIINSRPITTNPISISDTDAVRPIDFLLPQAELSIPSYNPELQNTIKVSVTEKQTREYLKHLDTIRLQLWDEFYREMYVGLKTPQYKNKSHSTITPQPNHVVIVETPNVPRYRWPLGRIIELLPSKDGEIRTVRIKCKGHVLERAISQLIPLELSAAENDPSTFVQSS